MVFQKKSGGKGNKGKNKKPSEHSSELDMDFEEGNAEDDQLMKSTSKGKISLGTPKGKQVSFHIPGKNTPANKTPKFVAKTPNSGKKKQLAPGYKGTTMKEFQGMKAGFNKPKNGKVKDEDSSDDDDDEDDDDDDDDDEDFNLDLGGGDGKDDDDDDKDDDDDDDDDEDDDDDDDEDDDDEVEMLDKHKKVMKTNKEEKVKTPKSEKVEATKPGKKTQVVKSEAKSSPKKVPDENVQQEIASQLESLREIDLRTLYIGNLPLGIEPEEIKTLSSDILEVRMPTKNLSLWKKPTLYAYVVFISEEKAQSNYNDLQGKELRGAKLKIDFTGAKSKNKIVSENTTTFKRLIILGFPSNTTIDEVAEIFPKSFRITLNKAKVATVEFHTVEEAAAGFKAGKEATVKGTHLNVQYAFSKKRMKNFNRSCQVKRKFVKGDDEEE